MTKITYVKILVSVTLLTVAQLADLRLATGWSKSELIREAVDEYYRNHPELLAAINATAAQDK